ncbi:DNA-binding protein [Dokdonella sp.]|uniref:DNA-binding protein n=1 Tax=Dokdonella sp. TaxID=2291710 RepID=UPI0025C4CE73|nr:DNA-binding protein [Dokdonella sp.]
MARSGITQAQVNEAADALLRAGERPTIERVRQVLGTGSPNTVVRLLEVWWSELGQRLLEHEAKLALPDAPDSVVTAASQLWLTALDAAKTIALSALEGEREQLAAERQAHIESAQILEAESTHAREQAELATAARSQAETRFADLERLAATQSAQLLDLQAQRDAVQSDRDALTSRVSELQGTIEQIRTDATAERHALETQARLNEDRWMQEVDRGRQEVALLQKTLSRRESIPAPAVESTDEDRKLRFVPKGLATLQTLGYHSRRACRFARCESSEHL